MQKFIQILVFSFISLIGFSQEDFNLELISNVSVGERGNDVWGYVDSTGTEYAIMGSQTKTTIWSLEDPANPIVRAEINGPSGTWRDIKSYEDHLYVTSDQGSAGLLIIDMSGAPETITSQYWKPLDLEVSGDIYELTKCHNLYIDTEQGFCYLAGCGDVGREGVLILDLKQDKKVPVLVGAMDNNYSHDVFVKDDKMYTSDIFLGTFGVYDITDKSNPVLLGSAETSRRFTHNAWLSDDGNYLFTTDERANAWVDAFDISDLENIEFLDRYRPLETEGNGVIPHNTHYHKGFLVTSWYTDGVVVIDATKPDNLVKVASYDTELVIPNDFEGCWGAYPFLPSGLVLAGDRNHGLFVLQPKTQNNDLGYQRACYLEGTVTDKNTGAAIPNARIEILSDNPNESSTQLSGKYKTGQVTPGEFMVEFSHPNYDPEILTATLESGEVTILDAQLGNTELTGKVIDTDGNALENAKVLVENTDNGTSIFATADEEGNWSVRTRSNITYSVYAALWGYTGVVQEIELTEENNTIELTIDLGYEDDFFVDLGWETGGTANSGLWEIAAPNFIFGSGQTTQTSSDINSDLGNTYYVTGADGNSQGANDVDDGTAVLTSPEMDFSGYDRIDFSYYLWFANVSGQGAVNDYVTVSITDGVETIELTRDEENDDQWSSIIETSVEATELNFDNPLRIIVQTEDVGNGHVVEAGFDSFKATGFKITSTEEVVNLGLTVFPNPTDRLITLRANSELDGVNQVIITDNSGRVVLKQNFQGSEMNMDVTELNSGLYSIQLIGKNKRSETIRFSKI
ncbi:MAG: choice-of-anchor B family protein [Saprospiraceae bacterium]|nr:choice-of-anchor B family protein [Saprospiraceae bacterium]